MTATLLILIPLLPLAAAIIVACFGWALKGRSHLPIVAAIGVSFLLSLGLLKEVQNGVKALAHETTPSSVGYETTVTLWTWADVADAYPTKLIGHAGRQPVSLVQPQQSHDFRIEVTLRADPLTAIMLAMVTFISMLVAIYASGYMHGDPGYWRFFAYIGLFVFSMTMLVSASNFALLYVFWEAVGLCSYLLVGFWYQKPSAVAAGKKAFLVTRIGDFGFAIGLFLIWCTYGTLDFHDTVVTDPATGATTVQTAGVLGQTRLTAPSGVGYVGGAVGTAICLLLLAGACGKSAQFPLHVWLPDAMEGPTPVSALIHAATMVTAGVYMVTRCSPLFFAAPQAQHMVALVGCFTALLAGLIAITQTDLKRVLAYSTVSQLGYMFLSVGAGVLPGVIFGMFHLFTHAFFKSLLFLGSGSVMHAMGGVVDMRKFGGLRKLMPITCWTFLIGSLALAGVVPFAGFWSKDGILATLYQRAEGHYAEAGEEGGSTSDKPAAAAAKIEAADYPSDTENVFGIAGLTTRRFHVVLFWAAMFTALLTAFYTFRAFFLTFFGPERIPPEAGHHAHESPPAMTVPLVILAICATVVGFVFIGWFGRFLSWTPSLSATANHLIKQIGVDENDHNFVAVLSSVLAAVGIGGAAFLYLGERRQATMLAHALRPLYLLSYGKFFFDPIYDWLVVRPLAALAVISDWFDRWVIDGLVNLAGAIPPLVGAAIRSLQNGVVQFYALAMILGLLVLIGALVAWPS